MFFRSLRSLCVPVCGVTAAAVVAGCCKKKVCRTPPPPTRVVKVSEDKGGREDGKQKVRVEHRQVPATKKQIEWFRTMAEALIRVQDLLMWHTRTRGERSMLEQTYAGRERLLSRRALAMLDAYLDELSGPERQEERRATEYLRDYLATEYVNRKTAFLDDKRRNLAARATVKLDWQKQPVAFNQLPVMLSKERSADRRKKLQEAIASVYEEKLNPVLLAKVNKEHELAQWMGYASYFELSEQVRKADIRKLLLKGHAFKKSTQGLFDGLMKLVVRETLGKKLSEMRRRDHLRLMRAPKAERFLPRELMLPAFIHFLEGIGLDLKTSAGTKIRIDDVMHPKKNPRAACFPIEVPSDVRITVKPKGGITSWSTLFHEGGHALHFAWTKQKWFEFQYLGNNTATEAYAELFARVWAEPKWLERYEGLVRKWNRKGTSAAERRRRLQGDPHYIIAKKMGMVFPRRRLRRKRVPVMTKKDVRHVIRSRLAWEMYLYRRYGWAKLIYESALHGADASVWKGIYPGQISNRKKLYRSLFSEAYGYPLKPADAAPYLADVDPFFYSADYARAFMGADMLIEHLRKKFGASWFEDEQVGPYLKTLWAKGTRWTGEEMVRHLGFKGLSYAASETRLKRLAEVAGVRAEGKGGAEAGGKAARGSRPRKNRGNKKGKPCPGGKKPNKRGMCPIPIPR